MEAVILFVFFIIVGTAGSNESKRLKACKDSGGVMVEVTKGHSECKQPQPTP